MVLRELVRLADSLLRSPPDAGTASLEPVPGMRLLARSQESAFDASLYDPVLCLILRGKKEVSLGKRVLSFGAGECLLVSHDMPVYARVSSVPYLALVFCLQLAEIRRLYEELIELDSAGAPPSAALVHRADPELQDALRRYLALEPQRQDYRVLGQLLSREIHYRLLSAPFGGMLRSLLRLDSSTTAITRAIGHIRANLRLPLSVPTLARRVGMSESAFHKHFREITSTSPLQYQKELRLLEARSILQTLGAAVGDAAFQVGYESQSQFSREYARKFGHAPSLAARFFLG